MEPLRRCSALLLVALLTSCVVPVNRPAAASPGGPGQAPRTVVVFGDSVAWSLGFGAEPPVLDPLRVTFDNRATWFCELLEGSVQLLRGELDPRPNSCDGWRTLWRDDIVATAPDAALLSVGPWEILDHRIGPQVLTFGSGEYDTVMSRQLDDAIEILGSGGATVFVVTTPWFDRDVADLGSPLEWTVLGRPRVDHFNALLRAAAARHPGTRVLELGSYVCRPGADPCEIDGADPRYDGVHYSHEAAPTVLGWLLGQMRIVLDGRRAVPR